MPRVASFASPLIILVAQGVDWGRGNQGWFVCIQAIIPFPSKLKEGQVIGPVTRLWFYTLTISACYSTIFPKVETLPHGHVYDKVTGYVIYDGGGSH